MTLMANASADYLVRLGYRVVLEGELSDFRDMCGMSRNAQAMLIGVEGESLKRWEQLTRAMNIDTALRIGEWFWGARKALEAVPGIDFDELIPASRAAQHLGIPMVDLEDAIVGQNIKHEQLGVLGTFIYRSALNTTI